MKSELLNRGTNAIVNAHAKGSKIRFSEFRVGEDAAIPISRDAINPSPVTVYTGSSEYIFTSVVDNDTLRVTLKIPETVGGFNIGNIILYVSDAEGNKVPFGYGVGDVQAPKYASSDTSVGVSVELSMFFKYVNIIDAVNITVVSPEYSSLQSYKDESELPDASQFTYQQVYIQNYIGLNRPIMVSRRAVDDRLFGFPFLQRIDNPRFGWIDGGSVGDGYKPDNGEVIFGYYYVTPEGAFNRPPITGGVYSFDNNDFDDDPYISDPY